MCRAYAALKSPLKRITGPAFAGTKIVTVTLKRWRYEYYCKPHRSIGMKGIFRVS